MIEKLPDSNAIKSEGPPDKPEDWPRLFEGHLNAGALEAVIALYEPDATIIAPSGETLPRADSVAARQHDRGENMLA